MGAQAGGGGSEPCTLFEHSPHHGPVLEGVFNDVVGSHGHVVKVARHGGGQAFLQILQETLANYLTRILLDRVICSNEGNQ